ncbi:MAG: hypothetical protein HQL98_03055 [Magnetococcales bacterium]|nr:hypothetical protein [Magnetococcales bacterium]
MTHATVQGLLKNTDLLLDKAEIRSVLASACAGKRPLELHAGSGRPVRQAILTAMVPGDSLTLTVLDSESGNGPLSSGMPVVIYFHMGGYSLESKLECLGPVGPLELRVGYPAMFRVHSKRQVSRFTVPMNMTCQVEMILDQTVISGELQDINPEGLSFLDQGNAGDNPVAIPVNATVRVRLIPSSEGDLPIELTGVLRFSGREPQPGGVVIRHRHSLHVTGMADPESFRRFFGKISSSSHGWFRASVISAESYRLTTAI